MSPRTETQDAQQHQETATRWHGAEFWHVFEHVDAAVAVTDLESRFLWTNRAYAQMAGYQPHELVGLTPRVLRSPHTSPESIRALWDTLAACGRFRGRLINKRADGTLFHADLSLVRMPASATAPGYVLATMRDVTVDQEMEERLSTLARQATDARDCTILALASLAEQRDRTTGLHLQRMEAYTVLLADWVLARHPGAVAEPALVGRCAMLHDIGKVGIPDAVLLKPGKLDEAEQAIMRQHPALGADIIDRVLKVQPDSGFLRVARDIVAHHHEAWDGTGYPQGLAGDDIPLHAQLVVVADVFDALTSDRPYKRAVSLEDAFAWIAARAGTQFGPLAVQALEACREGFVDIHGRLGDAAGNAPIEGSGIQRPVVAPARKPRASYAVEQPAEHVVLRVLEEALGSPNGGEVVVRSAKEVGRIYVYRGHVAWAHATSVRGVLTDRLLEEGVRAEDLEQVVQECRRDGKNLGEVLVEWQLLSPERFREILRHHVRARVRAILAMPGALAMFVPQHRAYSGRFTFDLPEVAE